MPKQRLAWNSRTPYPAVNAKAWMSGTYVAGSLGGIYELYPNFNAICSAGYHVDVFPRINGMDLSPSGYAAEGFTLALGLEWWP